MKLSGNLFYLGMTLCLLAPPVHAQDLVENKAPEVTVKEDGWFPSLKLGASFSQQSNSNVIGQQDGDSVSLGVNVESGLNFKRDNKEWRQSLSISGATAKSPSVPRFNKSADELKYETIYLYGLESRPWLGPYAKASVQTQAFKGEDVRATTTTYAGAGGNATGTSFRLTDGFKPMTTKESVGFFAKLIEKEKLKLETRLGVGALQVSADDQLAVDSFDAATNTVTLKALESYNQSGVEIGADLTGKIDEKSSYSLGVELFQPISPDLKDGDERSDSELLDSLIKAKLTSKMYEWMSLSLEAKYQRQPQLQTEEQKSISLLVNFTHTIL